MLSFPAYSNGRKTQGIVENPLRTLPSSTKKRTKTFIYDVLFDRYHWNRILITK